MAAASTPAAPASTPATAGDPPLFVGAMHGVRGLAVAAVVVLHLALNARWLPHHEIPLSLLQGSFVSLYALFFTTGFVLFLPVALKGGMGDLRSFAIRRFARIAPAYYVCLLVIVLAYPLLAGDVVIPGTHRGVTDYLVHVVFLQRELLPSDVGFGVDGPLWALSMDVLFYILFPLIAGTYLRHPFAGLAVGLGISLIWRLLLVDPLDPGPGMGDGLNLAIQFPMFACDFAAGMTGAWLFVALRRSEQQWLPPGAAVAVAVAALAGIVGLTYRAGLDVPFVAAVFLEQAAGAVAFPVVLLLFVVSITQAPAWAQWPLTNRATFWFSEISYSIYIYHALAIVFAFETLGVTTDGDPRSVLRLAAVVLPITFVAAVLSYCFVERPARRYGRKLAARLADRPDSASSARRSKWASRRRSSSGVRP